MELIYAFTGTKAELLQDLQNKTFMKSAIAKKIEVNSDSVETVFEVVLNPILCQGCQEHFEEADMYMLPTTTLCTGCYEQYVETW